MGVEQLSGLLRVRGIYLGVAERRAQASAYFRESARRATQADDNFNLGVALLNLSDVLVVTDPAAAADAARAAAVPLRRVGQRNGLAVAINNLVVALLEVGDWDTADDELTRAADADGLADIDLLSCVRGWLAALRGDAGTAEAMLAGLRDLRASEDPRDISVIGIAEAFMAAARRQPRDALRHARAVLAHADALAISNETMRWAWPLAARAALELRDTAATAELLALLDSRQPGHLAPMLGAERELVRARLAAADGAADATAAFAAAVTTVRELSTPYHLAHGLLDHAQFLLGQGDAGAAVLATEEARDISERLRCEPLLARAADTVPAEPRAPA